MATIDPGRRLAPLLAGLVLAGVVETAPAAALEQRFGLGFQYWKTVDELAGRPLDAPEVSALTWVASYQLAPVSFFKLQLDVEFFPQGFLGSGEEAWSPQGYLVLGKGLYAAVGAGWIYSQDIEGNLSDVFYAVRAGTELRLRPRLRLDLHADYRFSDWGEARPGRRRSRYFGSDPASDAVSLPIPSRTMAV